MSNPEDPFDGPSDEILAAEYVLGVLGAAERRQAEAREAADPAFAAEVAGWRERLSPLLDQVAPEAPPSELWTRIEAQLAPHAPANDLAPGARSPPVWRGLAWAAGGALAASVAWVLALGPLRAPQPTAPLLVARLAPSPGERSVWVASFDPLRRSVDLVPAEAASRDPRARELWLIPADGKPRALGVFDPARPVSMPMPPGLAGQVAPQGVLAVSLEPPGGSPTGQPTGPVIAKGPLSPV